MWKVEIRKNCKICGKPLPSKRHRTFCSPSCRYKEYNQRYRVQHRDWQRRQWGKPPDVAGTKIQCPLCDGWYIQLGTHIIQRHGYETARQFREEMGLDVKRGTVPEWYRELKGDEALSNGTWENLRKGKRFWFEKGSKVAGRYERSPQTQERLRIQGLKIGNKYGGKKDPDSA